MFCATKSNNRSCSLVLISPHLLKTIPLEILAPSYLKKKLFSVSPELFLSENSVISLKTLIILHLLPISACFSAPFYENKKNIYISWKSLHVISVILFLPFLSNPFQLVISLYHPIQWLLSKPTTSLHSKNLMVNSQFSS